MCLISTTITARPAPGQSTKINGSGNTFRSGFTLFEIAISLAIMGFAVISVLMVFPLGLKEQQQARARLLAATKTMELIEYFAGKSNSERMAEFETPEPWDTRPFCYTNTRWDLETRLARFDSGIRPLPLDIARRLDSDSDEIQRLLGEGAYIYYADATIIPGLDIRMRNPAPPGEANKIIFAVNGYAQNNAVPVLPWKAWPYRAGYPSPPLAATFGGSRLVPFNDANVVVQSPKGGLSRIHPLEGWVANGAVPPTAAQRDPLMLDVFKKAQEYTETANPQIGPNNPPTVMVLTTKRTALAGSCLAYAQDVFTRINRASDYQTYVVADSTTTAAQFQALGNQWRDAFNARCRNAELAPDGVINSGREAMRTELGQEVQAWRFLANAAAMFYTPKEGEAPPDLSMERMGTIPVSVDRLRYYHDRCVESAMRYAASFPYDWTAPRPQARAIMMDYPLIEFDLFSAPRVGTMSGSGNQAAAMWRPISAQRVTGMGLPGVFPGMVANSAWNNTSSPFGPFIDRRDGSHPLWGNAQHFTLTRPFHPSERCRELVFWSVDWQSYEDAELAPAAPLDASRTPCSGVNSGNLNNYDGRLNGGVSTEDALHLRNPERMVSFRYDVSLLSTGSDVSNALLGASPGSDLGGGSRTILLGIYGADRNRNYQLDRGPVPRSVRMRASQIARFTFYDPRLPITLR